ncbi:MAG: hypothetical protein ACP5UU_05425 [Thermoprotei archaeon]
MYDRASDMFYSMEAVCTRFGYGLLMNVEGFHAHCPIHGAVYDVRTGERMAEPVQTLHLPRFLRGKSTALDVQNS